MQATSGYLGGEGRLPCGGGRQQHDDWHVQGGGDKFENGYIVKVKHDDWKLFGEWK